MLLDSIHRSPITIHYFSPRSRLAIAARPDNASNTMFCIPRLIAFVLPILALSLLAATPTPSSAPDQEKKIPNAAVGLKVMFRNDKDEIMLVFDDRRQAWEVPGATHQGQATTKQMIDSVARDLGITFTDLRLGGLFTYHNPESGTTIVRPYYTARLRGSLEGSGVKVEAKTKWFSPAEATKAIPYRASVQIIEKLMREPEHVWAAAFEEHGYTSPMTDHTNVKFRVIEDFYRLN